MPDEFRLFWMKNHETFRQLINIMRLSCLNASWFFIQNNFIQIKQFLIPQGHQGELNRCQSHRLCQIFLGLYASNLFSCTMRTKCAHLSNALRHSKSDPSSIIWHIHCCDCFFNKYKSISWPYLTISDSYFMIPKLKPGLSFCRRTKTYGGLIHLAWSFFQTF